MKSLKANCSLIIFSWLAVVGVVFFFSCSDDDEPAPSEDGNVVQVIQNDSRFSTLAVAIQGTGLEETLAAPGPFTVFAPTNQAFIDAGIADVSVWDVDEIREILLYHVVSGKISSNEMASGSIETLLAGTNIEVLVNGGNITINDTADVVNADIEASNGVIHGIDAIVMPASEE